MIREIGSFFSEAYRSAGPTQLTIIGMTTAIVVAGVVLGRRWYVNRPDGGARFVVADALAVIMPYLVGLLIIGIARLPLADRKRPRPNGSTSRGRCSRSSR